MAGNLSKFAWIPLCIVLSILYFFALTNFTTSTDDYTLEKLPNDSIQPNPDPVLLSLDISLAQLQNVSSSLVQQTLFAESSNNPQTQEALRNCTFLLLIATSHVEHLMNVLKEVGQGYKVLAAPEILSLGSLIKASVVCQETCLDGLEKMRSTSVNDFIVKVQRSKQCTNNSSEIFVKIFPVGLRATSRKTCLFGFICVTSKL